MAIVIERTITVNNDKSILDNPLYLYVGDGDITYLFTIKERKRVATFGELGSSNSLLNEINGYGEVRIYKPDGSEPVFTTRAEIVDDKLQAVFSSEHIDQLTEAGTHQLQIHLYDDDDSVKNRFTIPPIELNVLFPVGTGPNIVGAAEVDYAEAAAEAPIDTFLGDGSYNKTTWATGDKITSGKLNKIEEALYQINKNGDYVTSQELEVALRSKANASHTHSDYALKSSIPTVPTRTSQLTNDSGYVTESVVDNKISDAKLNGGSSVDLSNYATKSDINEIEEVLEYLDDEIGNKANKSEIPTKTSQLTNDSGFITNATLPTVPTKVSELANDKGYITSVPSEYVTDSELTAKNYANKDYVTSAINNAQLGGGSDGSGIDMSIYATKDDLNNKANKSDIPTVPTKVSAFDNDAKYVTESVVDSKISNAQLGNGGNVDLSDYATISYVNQEINAIELTPGPEGPKGPKGDKGDKGDQGIQGEKGADGTVAFENLTEEQIASLKGDSFTYADMTPENKADLTRGFVTCSDGITRIEVVDALPETEEDGVLYIVKNE